MLVSRTYTLVLQGEPAELDDFAFTIEGSMLCGGLDMTEEEEVTEEELDAQFVGN